jgi:hypothetical protein
LDERNKLSRIRKKGRKQTTLAEEKGRMKKNKGKRKNRFEDSSYNNKEGKRKKVKEKKWRNDLE